MGFLSKVFKGVKKVFKKVGKAIKRGLKSVGKFMDKIGIVGQIGLSLLLPGIGSALSGMWGSLVGGMQAYSGLGSTIINGAGNFLNAATQVASRAGRAFSSITEGVKNVVGETLKLGANKLGLGEVASKMGFEKLGASISEASFDKITGAFDTSKQNFFSSFTGDAFTPDSAFEAARKQAANITDVPVTPQPTDIYEASLKTPDIEVAPVETATLEAPALPETVPSADGTISRPASKSLLEKAQEQAGQFIEDAPTKAREAVERGIESSVVTGVRRATGVEQAPEYETTYYGTYVPQLDFSNTAIATPSAEFNPVQFASTNTQLMNMYPFGATAQLYNDATYATQMRQYGYA